MYIVFFFRGECLVHEIREGRYLLCQAHVDRGNDLFTIQVGRPAFWKHGCHCKKMHSCNRFIIYHACTIVVFVFLLIFVILFFLLLRVAVLYCLVARCMEITDVFLRVGLAAHGMFHSDSDSDHKLQTQLGQRKRKLWHEAQHACVTPRGSPCESWRHALFFLLHGSEIMQPLVKPAVGHHLKQQPLVQPLKWWTITCWCTPPKMDKCPLNRNHFKRERSPQPSFFKGYVSFRGGVEMKCISVSEVVSWIHWHCSLKESCSEMGSDSTRLDERGHLVPGWLYKQNKRRNKDLKKQTERNQETNKPTNHNNKPWVISTLAKTVLLFSIQHRCQCCIGVDCGTASFCAVRQLLSLGVYGFCWAFWTWHWKLYITRSTRCI